MNSQKCERVSEGNARSIWDSPVHVNFESGKTLETLQTYHLAQADLTLSDNAIEKYFFTKEYGFTRWEAYIPYSRCIIDYPNDPFHRCDPKNSNNFLRGRCAPLSSNANWGGQEWVRVDCRDSTKYSVLSNPVIPVNSSVANSNGLFDIDSTFQTIKPLPVITEMISSLISSDKWTYQTPCPTTCGLSTSTQNAVCTGGACSGTAPTRSCKATALCVINTPVNQLYKMFLYRDGDSSGSAYYQSRLSSGSHINEIAWEIFSSSESVQKNGNVLTMPKDQYVELLYKTILGRASDVVGKNTYLEIVDVTLTRRDLFNIFMDSAELRSKKPILFSYVIKNDTVNPTLIKPMILGDFASCIQISSNLHRGGESEEVSSLQNFLTQKGFLEASSTGFYGDKTVEAVKDYQASRKLPLTGMVYDFTRKAIEEETCKN